jgi:hypothetical protein
MHRTLQVSAIGKKLAVCTGNSVQMFNLFHTVSSRREKTPNHQQNNTPSHYKANPSQKRLNGMNQNSQ